MKKHIAKQIILKYVYETMPKNNQRTASTLSISEQTGIDVNHVYAYCTEMGNINHLDIKKTSSAHSYYEYIVMRHPIGDSFLKNGGYKREYIKNSVKDFPKTYWWIIAIIAWIIGLLTPVIQNMLSQRK